MADRKPDYASYRRKPIKEIQRRVASMRGQISYGRRDLVQAADELTDVVLDKDPDWVRGVVARELRKALRLPEEQWPDRDKRMARVAEMRGAGLSIRAIAHRLGLSVGTVHRDLERRGEGPSKVTKLPFQKRRSTTSETPAATTTPDQPLNAGNGTPIAEITPLRRSS